jgi:hypothetical protein
LAGCPTQQKQPVPSDLQPAAQIPAEDPLLKYENLRLGMSNFEVAQVYNAPEGKGKGFTRVVEEYDDARNHIIEFEAGQGQPRRRIVLRVYQDKLAKMVDRQDGLTEKQAAEWLMRLKQSYGEPRSETLNGAQWVWGDPAGISLTYTQDNSSATNISANVVLVHAPTYDASERYTAYREQSGSD